MNIIIRKYRARGKHLHPNWVAAQDNTFRVLCDGRLVFSDIPTREIAEAKAEEYRRKMTYLCPSCGENVIEVGVLAGYEHNTGKPQLLCTCGRFVTKEDNRVE